MILNIGIVSQVPNHASCLTATPLLKLISRSTMRISYQSLTVLLLFVDSVVGRYSLGAFVLTKSCRRRRTSCSSPSKLCAAGLYRPIAEMVWEKLLDTKWASAVDIDSSLQSNQAPAKGMPGAVVRMETRALEGAEPLSYARMALLETVPEEDENHDGSTVHTQGIQVLNLVIFPSSSTNLPVWGADFVSLPGNKHLLLLDAQPMTMNVSYTHYWDDWYKSHEVETLFPWGGDMPEPVQRYVSSCALWTRFGKDDTPLDAIQGPLFEATKKHLEIYLDVVKSASDKASDEHALEGQKGYVNYRRNNDPAQPMLKSLYGEEWTERVLSAVLFPQL